MIAVYGGCFNPPTVAHIKTIGAILKLENITKLIIFPLANNYPKPDLADFKYRYEMLNICFKNNEKVKISSLDMRTPNQLTTIEYMEIFDEIFDEELAFVMGTDNLKYISTWNDADKLMEKFYHIVIKREDDDNIEEIIEKDELLKKSKDKFIIINNIGLEFGKYISSTKARKAIRDKDGDSLKDCLTEDIIKYIEEKELYR